MAKKQLLTEDELLRLLKRFMLECVHGGDFDQGQTERETLSTLTKWWKSKRHEDLNWEEASCPICEGFGSWETDKTSVYKNSTSTHCNSCGRKLRDE